MEKFQYLFHELDSQESMAWLAAVLDASYSGNTINIHRQGGQGIIRKMKLEGGLQLWAADFTLAKTFEFCKTTSIAPNDNIFHLVFFLNPESIVLKKKKINKSFPMQKGMNVLFLSDSIDIELEIPAGKHFQSVFTTITASWLRKAYASADRKLLNFIEELAQNKGPAVFFETTSAAEYRTLADVQSAAVSEHMNTLQIKAQALSLISAVLDKLFAKSVNELMESRFVYHEQMIAVEKMLVDHIQGKLPGIDVIAKSAAMSVSTLKRHFKLMYGKSIYDYYLGLKMEFAKKLMTGKAVSVNEVAFMLDYEKVSNFINMFKRHHGVSPGALRAKLLNPGTGE